MSPDKFVVNKDLFEFLKKKFLSKNPTFRNHFLIFSFDLNAITHNTITPGGQVQDIGIFNAILYKNRNSSTMAHEILHGFGLRHTHIERDKKNDTDPWNFYPITSPDSKYIYYRGDDDAEKNKATDNIMSYYSQRKSLWHWQWKIIHRRLNNEYYD